MAIGVEVVRVTVVEGVVEPLPPPPQAVNNATTDRTSKVRILVNIRFEVIITNTEVIGYGNLIVANVVTTHSLK